MFAKTQMGGMDFAFPDVCLTPIPSPVGPIPTPIPYPNIAIPMMAIPSQFKVLTMCMPNHNLMTITPMSNGDNAGLFMNPLSGMVMGPQRNLFGSVKNPDRWITSDKNVEPFRAKWGEPRCVWYEFSAKPN